MKHLPLLFSFLLLLSCGTDNESARTVTIPPDSIIPEAQMVLMLADVHMLEAALIVDRNRGKNVSDMADYYYAGLFRKYGVSRERYQLNQEYYRQDPDTFEKLYDKVIRELTDREKNFVKDKPR